MIFRLLLGSAILLAATAGGWADDLDRLLVAVKSVGPKAENAEAAAAAWTKLSAQDPAEIPALLSGLKDANPLAANYLRSAVDTIAERTLADGGKLPADKLEAFINDTSNDPRGRRQAFELLRQVDDTAEARLTDKWLNDLSAELRRDAVALKLDAAGKAKAKADQISMLRAAYDAAVDDDQVKAATERLKELGEEVDVARHYGFLVDWHLVGPFDNKEEGGFDQLRGPEGAPVKLTDKFEGSHEAGVVTWQAESTDDDYGKVDIAAALDKHKGAICYAYTTYQSDKPQQVQFRLTSKNACKLWLNGKLIDSREVYHAGGALDQYISTGELKQGKNEILLKICQNEQDQPWAQSWGFQLRISDSVGAAILAADRDDKPRKGKQG